SDGMCEAIASTGAPSRCASNRPWIRCVLPGPQEPAHTASFPVSRASAPAAKAPASSLRTCTHSMPSVVRTASTTGLSESPTTPESRSRRRSRSWVTRSWAQVVPAMVMPPGVQSPGGHRAVGADARSFHLSAAPVMASGRCRPLGLDDRRDHSVRPLRATGHAPSGDPSDPTRRTSALLGLLALLGHGLLGREPHRLHPALVDPDHLELAAVNGDGVPGPWDAAQLGHEEAAHRLVAAGVRQTDVRRGLELLEDQPALERPVGLEDAVEPAGGRPGLAVELVVDLPHQLLEEILEGDDPVGAAVL